jgi:predicted nicotinamide N-methyase
VYSQEVSEDLMSTFSVLLSSSLPTETISAQQKSYVTYTLASLSPASAPSQLEELQEPSDLEHKSITILEARSILSSSGTTGLRTWEASLHLGEYLCQPTSYPLSYEKTILELGAGTGYISILCAKYLGAKYVVATDGSDEVVAELPTNYFLNGLESTLDPASGRGDGDESKAVIEAKELFWGHPLLGGEEPAFLGGRTVDLVVGADVTYDISVIPSLVATIAECFDLWPNVRVLISATVRNEETFEKFLGICRKRGFGVRDVDFPVVKREKQEGPFYKDGTEIRICDITREGRD